MAATIQTKFLGPTDSRCSRILAKSQAGRIYVPYDHAKDEIAMHRHAAITLAAKNGWPWTQLLTGQLVDGTLVHLLKGDR